jgi:hypothetical protein
MRGGVRTSSASRSVVAIGSSVGSSESAILIAVGIWWTERPASTVGGGACPVAGLSVAGHTMAAIGARADEVFSQRECVVRQEKVVVEVER